MEGAVVIVRPGLGECVREGDTREDVSGIQFGSVEARDGVGCWILIEPSNRQLPPRRETAGGGRWRDMACARNHSPGRPVTAAAQKSRDSSPLDCAQQEATEGEADI